MSLKDPRADSLPLIRDFIVAISNNTIAQLSDFKKVIPNWERTRCYHYWSAIRDMNFAQLVAHRIKLTPLGERMVEVAKFGGFSSPGKLNNQEKEAFKTAFLRYEPIKKFFSYFISTGMPFSGYEQLREYGDKVILKLNPTKSWNDNGKRSIIIVTASGEEMPLSLTETRTIKWSFKLWCKELKIIDEIWLTADTWYSKYLERIPARIFFPIKLDIQKVELREFENMLMKVVKILELHHIFIPMLTYKFCTTYFVSLQDFHYKLVELYHSDPYHYYLETGSLVGVNGSIKIRDYENYPRVDGYVRNYVIVRK